MRLSFLRHGALRFQNRYWYRAHIQTSTGPIADEHQQSTLVRARYPNPTNTLPPLNPVDQRLKCRSSEYRAPSIGRTTDQHTANAEVEPRNEDGLQKNLQQAFPDGVLSLRESLIGSASVQISRRRVWDALQQRNPHELLPAFLDASQDPAYLRLLPSTTFIEILEILHPTHFVADVKKVYRDLHPSQIAYSGSPQLQEVLTEYTSNLREIIRRRISACGNSGIEEWRFLLQSVASIGDGVTALEIWTDMVNRKIEPDLACYNFYFEARCWSGAYLPVERHMLRVIPRNTQLRNMRKAESQHLQKLLGFWVGRGGLKGEISRMFAVMVNRGISADSKTFGLLMLALSREGDLQGAKSILNRVWNVDVDSILAGEQDPVEPTNLARESPLYPTKITLHTIAHIFGSNNELPTALRIVDYVSRKFSIPIGPKVWDELLEWTYVLSSQRHGARIQDGASQGQLPLKSVESLWDIMVSAPYNVRPDMRMYNYYCINLSKRQMLHAMLHQMRAGLALYRIQATEYYELRRLSGIDIAESPEQDSAPKLPTIDVSQQEIVLGALTEYRNFLMISRWFRLLLAGNRWGGVLDRIVTWERQELPNAVREFWHFRPRPAICYRIATGLVKLVSIEDQPGFTNRSQKGYDGSHFRKFNIRIMKKFRRARLRLEQQRTTRAQAAP